MVLIVLLLLVNATGYLALPVKGLGAELSARSVLPFVGSAWADDDDHERDGEKISGNKFWEELHEAVAGLLLGLIGLHILGAIASSVLHRENLVGAMISGRKKLVASKHSE